jgi:hypothetical protein
MIWFCDDIPGRDDQYIPREGAKTWGCTEYDR